MIELAQHIEALLLENDCVIVPGFGGFVAHYAPATHVKENINQAARSCDFYYKIKR